MPPQLRRSFAVVLALAAAVAATALAGAQSASTGLQAEYFDAPDLTGSPVVTRVDAKIDFNWGLTEPVAGVGDTFSVRWKGTIAPRYSEKYTLYVTSDDGVRVYVDGQILIDNFVPHAVATVQKEVVLTAGRKHEIEIEYHDIVRHAVAKLEWRSASQQREVVPSERLAPPSSAPALPVAKPEESGRGDVAPGTPATTTATPPPAPAALTGTVSDTRAADVPASILPPPAPPVAGETFNVEPTKGEVTVRRPGDDATIALEAGASLPVGTRVDSRDGSVQLETAPAAGVAQNQHATFGGATFRVSQPREGGKVVTIDMMHGDFESCATEPGARILKKGKARSAARRRGARAARKSVRELWGSGKGRFRTRGRHAAATVRGTQWSIEDRCDATVVRVREGLVDVEDFASGKTVPVKAGQSFVATAGPRRAGSARRSSAAR